MAAPGLAAPALGIAAALTCALAWTVLSLLVRRLSTEFSAFSLNIIRSGVGAVLLLPIALVTSDLATLRGVSPSAWAYLMASVVTAVGIGDTAFFESTKTLGLARAMTISTSYPLLASALAFWIFDERITLTIAVGSLVTLGGLVLIVSEGPTGRVETPGERKRGLGLALLAALAWAVSATLMKAPLHEVDPISAQAVRLPLTTLALWATPWARGTLRTFWARRRAVAWPVAALGALTAFSAVAYLAALKYSGVTLGTVLSSVSPLFALPIGRVFFHEAVTWRAAIGAALAVTGIGLLGA